MVDILCFEKSDNDPDQDQFAPFRNVDQIDLHIIDDRPMVNEMMMMMVLMVSSNDGFIIGLSHTMYRSRSRIRDMPRHRAPSGCCQISDPSAKSVVASLLARQDPLCVKIFSLH